MRILIAEDDPLLGEALSMGLREMGYRVDWVRDGPAAEHALQSEKDSLDALVLDLGLPRRDGLTILDRLRRSGSTLPVLILTARDTVKERIAGLDTGADDYVVKPFDLMEVSARLRAITRRRAGRSSPRIEYGPMVLDQASRTVTLHGESIGLSSQEMAVLAAKAPEAGVRDRDISAESSEPAPAPSGAPGRIGSEGPEGSGRRPGDVDFFGDPVNTASKLGEDLAIKAETLVTKRALEHSTLRIPETAKRMVARISDIEINYVRLPMTQVDRDGLE